MRITIKHPSTSESYLVNIDIQANKDETTYYLMFTDKRISKLYNTIVLKRNHDDFWKFPDNCDNFLLLLLSDFIFQIMNKTD